jgi:hypothetical protein
MTMQANTIYRFECQWTLSATVGRAIINCYLGDSTTVLETMDSTANQNFGGTTFNSLDIGYRTNGTSSQYGTMLVDGFGLSTTGYLGPVDGISLPTTAALSGVSR